MPLVVIAGAPGAGKTTLLAELARLGHHTVSDSAREVIRERVALGLTPRPSQLDFANEILRRDIEKYHNATQLGGLVFFERCGLEALAMLRGASPCVQPMPELGVPAFAYHDQVFVLAPWKEIYVTDAERDQTFEHAQRVHAEVVKFYPGLGFKLIEVPRDTPGKRAAFVLRTFTAASAA